MKPPTLVRYYRLACFPLMLTALNLCPLASALGDESRSCEFRPPYVAPPFVAPEPQTPESQVHLVDNGDGTLTDSDSGLMWVQKDSFADLGECLTWTGSQSYVRELKTGGYSDWRMPSLQELASIYDPTKANVKAWDKNPDYPLALDEKFADGAAYWYWSSDCGATELTACCGKTLYFVNGQVHMRQFELCNNGGVRAVRLAKSPSGQ